MTKNQTNVCKGIALLLMYFHHLFYHQAVFSEFNIIFSPLPEKIVINIAVICKVCVAIFVFLTGYGYTRSDSADYIQNCKKRYFRLMFGYWFIFALALSTSFLGRNLIEVYGDLKIKSIYYAVIDGMGIAFIMGTPTYNGTWWYMSLAIIFVFLTPILIKVIKKKKNLCILIPFILIMSVLPIDYRIQCIFGYIFSLVLGIFCAENLVFEKVKKYFVHRHFVDIYISIVMVLFLVFVRKYEMYYLVDGLMAMIICYLVYRLVSFIPIINRILYYLGKYSMDGFLVHTLIYFYYFRKFIYSNKYFIVIWIILVLITLLVSIIIEIIKKWIGYDKLYEFMCNKVFSKALVQDGK